MHRPALLTFPLYHMIRGAFRLLIVTLIQYNNDRLSRDGYLFTMDITALCQLATINVLSIGWAGLRVEGL